MRPLVIILMCSCLAAVETCNGYRGYWLDVVATAYSPHDPIDSHYHKRKGDRWRYITADGRTDVRDEPYGVAVPHTNGVPYVPYGTKVIIPADSGYLAQSRVNRLFTIDDTGSAISSNTRRHGVVHIDLRFKTPYGALNWARQFGDKPFRVFIVLE